MLFYYYIYIECYNWKVITCYFNPLITFQESSIYRQDQI